MLDVCQGCIYRSFFDRTQALLLAVRLTVAYSFRPCPRVLQGWIDRSLLDRTRALLAAARLPVVCPPVMTVALFKSLMAVDKKVAAGVCPSYLSLLGLE